jgi:hypothetical protein
VCWIVRSSCGVVVVGVVVLLRVGDVGGVRFSEIQHRFIGFEEGW